MTTEVWFRKADTYPSTCIDLMVDRLSFRTKDLRYRAVNVERFLVRSMPAHLDYRALVIGNEETLELRHGSTIAEPYARYPTWSYATDDMPDLETLCDEIPDDREHRIVIIDVPSVKTGMGRRFYKILRDLQRDYPDVILHIHGLQSYRLAFGYEFKSIDTDPQATALREAVTLPNGRSVNAYRAKGWLQWLSVVGFGADDLMTEGGRLRYNIQAARWSAEHWRENLVFKSSGTHVVDTESPTVAPATTDAVRNKHTVPMVGDKVLCDQCSLASSCKFYREGEVCSLPGSEAGQLASTFKTRDPDTIIEGLTRLLEINSGRLEAGVQREADYGGGEMSAVDPSVTSLIASMFEQGTKLAKLLDPKRFSQSPKVVTNIGVGSGGSLQLGGTPQTAIAAVMREFEMQGIAREDVTPEMVTALLSRIGGGEIIDVPAIEGPNGT